MFPCPIIYDCHAHGSIFIIVIWRTSRLMTSCGLSVLDVTHLMHALMIADASALLCVDTVWDCLCAAWMAFLARMHAVAAATCRYDGTTVYLHSTQHEILLTLHSADPHEEPSKAAWASARLGSVTD